MAKDTEDRYFALDVRTLQRKGGLSPGESYTWTWTRRYALGNTRQASLLVTVLPGAIELAHQFTSGPIPATVTFCQVAITWTECHFGGQRPWFLCPTCGRRVAKLYWSHVFHCRRCLDLAYESQRESDWAAACSRAQRIKKRLGGSANMLEPFPEKPKGMHWKTYLRYVMEYGRAVEAFARAHQAFMARQRKQMARLKVPEIT